MIARGTSFALLEGTAKGEGMANQRDRNSTDPDLMEEVDKKPGERIGGISGEDMRGIGDDRDEEFEESDDLEDEEEEDDETDVTI
jgi:hypothetical protein